MRHRHPAWLPHGIARRVPGRCSRPCIPAKAILLPNVQLRPAWRRLRGLCPTCVSGRQRLPRPSRNSARGNEGENHDDLRHRFTCLPIFHSGHPAPSTRGGCSLSDPPLAAANASRPAATSALLTVALVDRLFKKLRDRQYRQSRAGGDLLGRIEHPGIRADGELAVAD